MKKLTLIWLLLSFQGNSQTTDCQPGPPVYTINFGSGAVDNVNTAYLPNYGRVGSSCPTDGHYSYTAGTSDCFSGDWHTLTEDHTPGDVAGNMLLVNASYDGGTFFTTEVGNLKGNTNYEFTMWVMNVCRITEKCPFPLLPNITVLLRTPEGKTVAQFKTGSVVRVPAPHWTPHRARFTTPPGTTGLLLTMINSTPGGCGNDFTIDDITFRECIKKTPVAKPTTKPAVVKKQVPLTVKSENRRPAPVPEKKPVQIIPVSKQPINSPVPDTPRVRQKMKVFPAPPAVLTQRSNTTLKQFETEQGEIKLDLYDNGEIDGDTVSIYHNNKLVVANAKLSQKPISLRIAINAENPHHELIMVAENLGTIPPNTSLMIVTAGAKRYQVFISSTEQKNGKVVFDLKE